MTASSPDIAQLLKHGAARLPNDSARLDAELLLCHVLDKPRTYLYTWPEAVPDAQQQAQYQVLLNKRRHGEPLAYLTGHKAFWSYEFEVTPDTLIPRPETELLVELSLQKLATVEGPFLDLGTGSGIIAICVAKECSQAIVTAVDNSKAALEVAQSNARRLGASVQFKHSNWFTALEATQYAVIAANPPYIAEDDPHLAHDGLPHEPISALRSCDNGFADITVIIEQAHNYLQHLGWLLIEHGYTQAVNCRNIMQRNQYRQVVTIKDLAGNDRVTLGQKHGCHNH